MVTASNSFDFSVLLAVYKKDNPLLFIKALESIFLNTIQPKKLVIVADGELSDQLQEVINEYSKFPYLKFIQLPKNRGLATALNAGLREITTKYTIRADADDFNHPNRFELLLEKLEEGYDLVGSAIKEVDKSGAFVAIRNPPQTEDDIKAFAIKRNPFNHMTVAFRTELVRQAGGYPSIFLKEDYALWATLLSMGCRVCNINSILVDATAGLEMFQRRGGFKYALAEIDLQTHLVRMKIKSPLVALIDGTLRSIIFLAPNVIREYVYVNFLRTMKV
jgi:glycosyltransferase involved in cell wall biosynthesis